MIDGLRFPEDHATLVEVFGPAFTHIHLECGQFLLERRLRERDEDTSLKTALAHTVESGIARLAGLAHVRLRNEGTKVELFNAIEHAVREDLCR